MSDEEAGSEQEIEPEEVTPADDAADGGLAASESADKQPKDRKGKKDGIDNTEGLTEGEKAMLAAKKRQEEEQAALLQDYEEKRRIEREKEEEELRKLKEKQERRRLEREEEEREFAEKLRQEEERRRAEEEERKARVEAERRKREEEKQKRKQLLAGSFASAIEGGMNKGRNFVIPKKTEQKDKFDNIFQAKQEMGLTREQQHEVKKAFLEQVSKDIEYKGLNEEELKEKIRWLHQRICKLEADKYDLEKRHERQQYDLKELNERQRQVFRNNALKKGIDPTDDILSSRYPPKVSLISKYERQIDRRNFAERRAVYENKDAHPCFPNVPPPPAKYEKVILNADGTRPDEKEGENEDEKEADEEEEE
ncbi:unnamed protein product [Enterobius vermicularis]|uniref:Troponin T n=1 Tax=Enterobius vermicularis TaxID=51028 RepID=A0A0N4UVW3_ENTVE|nr:unnamed protein product [Enterobius vermicularis]